MKRFKFSLDVVLRYKDQELEKLKLAYADSMHAVHEQQQILEEMISQYTTCNEEYRQRKTSGITIHEATVYQMGLRAQQGKMQAATKRLDELEEIAHQCKQRVIEAKRDISAIEKLREKRVKSYEYAMNKNEELLIDELVSARRASMPSA